MTLNALILRGKHKGRVVPISQWCNDWFTLDSQEVDIARKAWSPASLSFSYETMNVIKDHKNNGMLLGWYKIVEAKKWTTIGGELFCLTFMRR